MCSPEVLAYPSLDVRKIYKCSFSYWGVSNHLQVLQYIGKTDLHFLLLWHNNILFWGGRNHIQRFRLLIHFFLLCIKSNVSPPLLVPAWQSGLLAVLHPLCLHSNWLLYALVQGWPILATLRHMDFNPHKFPAIL